jgi:dienelactone hydrolase
MARSAWAQRLLPFATIYKPSGSGPWPLVIQLHGCGGIRPFQDLYAERALAAGYAVMIVDSLKPRGISRLAATLMVCTALALHGAERAADLYALFDWARNQPWVDNSRIVACGWSHGGWTIMDALAMGERAERLCGLTDLPPRPLDGLAGAIVIYPYASFLAMTRRHGWGDARLPVYGLLGGRDRVVGIRHPAEALDRLERDGLRVERLIFSDATHAFDDQGASDPRTVFRSDLLAQAVEWYGEALTAIAK